jgi:hypothetical protein
LGLYLLDVVLRQFRGFEIARSVGNDPDTMAGFARRIESARWNGTALRSVYGASRPDEG